MKEGQLECMEQLIADAASDVLIGALKTTDGVSWLWKVVLKVAGLFLLHFVIKSILFL